MNKKTYCTPAFNVAEGALQSTLLAGSGDLKVNQQSLGTANETTRTYLNLNGYNAWSSKDNDENDEDLNF